MSKILICLAAAGAAMILPPHGKRVEFDEEGKAVVDDLTHAICTETEQAKASGFQDGGEVSALTEAQTPLKGDGSGPALEKALADLANANDEIVKLQRDFGEAGEKLATSDKEVVRLGGEVKKLEGENAKLKAEIEKLKAKPAKKTGQPEETPADPPASGSDPAALADALEGDKPAA